MKLFKNISRLPSLPQKTILAIGVFDGLHRGHQALIKKMIVRSRKLGVNTTVMTFSPHPIHILKPNCYLPLIISLQYRLKLLEDYGVNSCVVVPFTEKFSRITAEEFVANILVKKFNLVEVFVGDDFYFGFSKKGGAQLLKQLCAQKGYKVHIISTKTRGKKSFSSTAIRQMIIEGKLSGAARLLGRPVSVLGKVVHGDSRGTLLGYPTANLNPNNETIPPSGVYIVHVNVKEKSYQGIACIGRRPSFKRFAKINIEIHLFGFRGNIYDKEILVQFLKKIRDEKIFLSRADLIQQISSDESVARKWFDRTSCRFSL